MKEINRKTKQVLDRMGTYLFERHLHEDIDMHWHEFYELEYITAGTGTVYINDTAYPLRPNTLLFLSPVDFEQIHVETELSIINLAFSNELIMPKILAWLSKGVVIYDYPATLFDLLVHEEQQQDGWYYHKYVQLVNSILIDVVRSATDSKPAVDSSPILVALHYMNLNFKDPITLDQVSRHVGLSPNYFSALFAQKMHTNFKSYLTDLRLNYAAKMLVISKFSTAEICYASGFNDFSNFSRAFKKKFELSPSEYRIANKNMYT